MRASDLLTALSTNVFSNEYEGIYSMFEKQLLPITTIRVDNKSNLVLFREPKKSDLKIKDFYLALMNNKSKSLKIWIGSDSIDIFGFRMDGNKIVV
ncbi:hypothetical protein IGI39_003372 [Enterococcus sp. AZ135]|uniref:hypothetical protein n=1 Tax=unclassified Enterococcus TaxID=2608891 RepID=UPI003F29EE8E